MIIKKFQGRTEQEAVETAKKELGQNVVVMNVKLVKPKGLFKIFRKKSTEVTVAREEEEIQNRQSEARDMKQKTASLLRQEERISDMLPREALFPEEKAGKNTGIVNETATQTEKVLEERLNSLQNFLEQKLVKEEEHKEEEFAEEQSESVVFMQLLYTTMLENEVKEEYANQIIDEVEKVKKENMPIDYILSHVYQKIILKFGKTLGISQAECGAKVMFFIGPTGVGKTTTIAKIASKCKVDEKKKVALLTTDTYRIAAAEQLRTYANILEVPFRVIYTVEEIQAAVRDFSDYDYILVDTAGHSYKNDVQRDTTEQFLHALDGKSEQDVFLVLSATTKYKDMVNIADAYSKMTDYKLIFTKLDETASLGNLLNLRLYTSSSISYVTCGQNVPDDIERFNPQNVVKQLLGGKK